MAKVDVDDAFAAAVEFDQGAVGTIEASRFAVVRGNHFAWEINGAKGSIAFDLERLNELDVHLGSSYPGARTQGFRRVLVTEPDQPFLRHWWPAGHIVGWEHTFVHELGHLSGQSRESTTSSHTARISKTDTARPRCATP